ncbi:MAG: hypothetical protein V4585_17595 [Bacteroidota bacterium]
MNDRKNKLDFLNRAFNQRDLTGLEALNLGGTLFLNIVEDKGERRTAIDGDKLTVYNYSFDEIEILRAKLLQKYSIVWNEQKTYFQHER